MKRSAPLRNSGFKRKPPKLTDRGRQLLAGVLPKIALDFEFDVDCAPPAPLVPLPPPAPRARMAVNLSAEQPRAVPAALQKVPDRIDTNIRESARGEDCTVRIPGVCRGHPDYTIWSHAPLGSAGKGKSIKALDLCGAYCCTACDAVIDGQAPLPAGYSRDQALLDWFYGHARSLVRLRQKGLV